jgi:Zn-finger protein
MVEDHIAENSKTGEEEDWNDNEDEDEDEDNDEDIDKEAQEIARRLGEQLWADITKVNAERNAATASSGSSLPASASVPEIVQESTTSESTVASQNRRREDAIIATMKSILALVEKDAEAKKMMFSTAVPNGPSVLELLYQSASSGSIDKGIARPLSQAIILLAKSEVLFGNLRQSNAPAIQLDIGKRKREAFDEGISVHPHPQKRPYVPECDLHHQVVEAVRVISQVLGASPSQPIDPSLVSSIRLQLHQIFLFAVTSASVAGINIHALQEIGGLIQVIGVLSGIQIGHSPSDTNTSGPSSLPSYISGHHPAATDIGTAVYPCLIAGCGLTFARLYSLRAHQRSHASHRPHRCSYCPASFARNHDLKRHIKLHDRKAWKCQGCHKVFSRRDAIKRHKNGIKNRGATSDICLTAEVVEVQLEGAEAETAIREERRAKLWNEIAVNEAAGIAVTSSGHNEYRTVDDGAINPAVIVSIQTSILTLHGLLQTLVGNALGNPVSQDIPAGSSAGQATLASVIARAQSQSKALFPPHESPDQASMIIDAQDEPAEGHSSEFQGGENPEGHQRLPSLSMYGLSDEQTRLLEIAIANAASAAQAQAEAEAALEEQENGEENDYDEEDHEDSEMEQDKPHESQAVPGQ